MRGAFIRSLVELAEDDPRVVLLTGDLGFMVVEPFADRFPDRFVNVGVAEQNMTGIATGLAEAGFVPFTYSIATFSVLRPYEFIRNGPVLHNLPVRVVGVGGGFDYGHAGPTHHAVEDLAMMRALHGMTVVAPADHEQAAAAVRGTAHVPGPVYLRLGKDERSVVPGLHGRFSLGRAEVVRTGDDLVLVTVGSITTETVQAAEELSAEGIGCTVVVVGCLQPAPLDDLTSILAGFDVAMTVEAHSVVGGLGSLVCELVAQRGLGCRVVCCGVRSAPDGDGGGSEKFLNDRHGISARRLVRTARRELAARGPADEVSKPVR